jgi:ribosome-associated translation inhibitor RaiA
MMIQLGGNIDLTGFRELDRSVMIVVKKMVGNYVKKFAERVEDFEKLSLTLKTVHQTEKSEKYEIKAMLVHKGKIHNSERTGYNLFVAIDESLKALESAID